MKPLTIIIPSRNTDNLIACVEAVRRHEPDVRIIVVNDGIDCGRVPKELEILTPLFDGPFIFARNVNVGIRHAHDTDYEAGDPDADVVLLNDDAILETPGGLTEMQRLAEKYQASIGLVAATTNVCNNQAQHRTEGRGLRVAPVAPGLSCPAVAFVCVLIPGRIIEQVGLLDERFTAYGYEDTDYCRRLYEAGYMVGIFDGCFVDHSKLRSTFRGDPHAPGDIDEGRRIYLNKWGKL